MTELNTATPFVVSDMLEGAMFPFLSLPYEIQWRILSYSDLVTPLSYVKWDPHNKYHLGIERVQSCHPCRGAICEPPYDQCHPTNHRRCSRRLRPAKTEEEVVGEKYCPCPHSCVNRLEFNGAMCGRCTHYACQFLRPRGVDPSNEPASTMSAKYWAPPTSFFLVNSFFRNVSMKVFFSLNYFKISGCSREDNGGADIRKYVEMSRRPSAEIDLRQWRLPARSPPPRSGPSIFLSGFLPKDARSFLKRLRLSFSGRPRRFCHRADQAAWWNDWRDTADRVAPQLSLHVLRLRNFPTQSILEPEWEMFMAVGPDECADIMRDRVVLAWPPLRHGAASVLGSVQLLEARDVGSRCSHDVVYKIMNDAKNEDEIHENIPLHVRHEIELPLHREQRRLCRSDLLVDCQAGWFEYIWAIHYPHRD